MRRYAAVRFTEDVNLADRVYWYLADGDLNVGEDVFAPVGSHDRLQRARVEAVVAAEDGDAPYDPRLCKRVAARCGRRRLLADGVECAEFGGICYDGKRYTAFGRALFGEKRPAVLDELARYGVTEVVPAENALRAIARARGCVFVWGAGANACAEGLLEFLRTGTGAEELTPRERRALAEKLVRWSGERGYL